MSTNAAPARAWVNLSCGREVITAGERLDELEPPCNRVFVEEIGQPMSRRFLVVTIAAVLGLAFLTAYTSNGRTIDEAQTRATAPASPSLTFERAKALSLAVTADIAASVPEAVIASSRVVTESHLLQCGHSHRYQWPGFTDLTLVDGSDAEAVLLGLAPEWASRPGFEASREVDPDGTSSVTINAEHGINVYAFAEDSGRVLSLNSFSPCFDLPDGNLFDEY